MTQKFYRKKVVDGGEYIGSFDGSPPPSGAVEIGVEGLPVHGKMAFRAGRWVDLRSPSEIIAQAMIGTEDIGAIARKLEDVIDNIVNGTPLPLVTRKWASGRKTKRSKL